MLYIYLIITIAIGGLWMDDEHQRSAVDDLEAKVKTAESWVSSYEASSIAQDTRRRAELAALQKDQAQSTAALKAGYKKKLDMLTFQLRNAQLKGSIHDYLSPAADTGCFVTLGAVLYHDAAAAGGLADPGGAQVSVAPGRSVDADSGVHLSDLLTLVGDNYAGASDTIARLAAEVTLWRGWYVAQSALFDR